MTTPAAGVSARSIGIDVGGTKTAIALVDTSNGSVLQHRTIETRAQNGVDQLGARIVSVALDLTEPGAAVPMGVAVPEIVSPSGEVLTDVVVPGLRGRAAERLGLPATTQVESDVRAAALGEARFGAGKGRSSFLYLSIGTGISHCFVLNGEPWAGAHGSAILVGSGVHVDPRIDTGRDPVFLEAWAAGPGLKSRALAHGVAVDRGQDVIRLAATGDEGASTAVCETGRAVGLATGLLINLFDPEAVIVGGGLGAAEGPYWDSLLRGAREGLWVGLPFEVPVLQAGTGSLAGVIGAALVGERPRSPSAT